MMALDLSERPADGEALTQAIESTAIDARIPIGALFVRRARRVMSRYWE
jgi:hypothetical protein